MNLKLYFINDKFGSCCADYRSVRNSDYFLNWKYLACINRMAAVYLVKYDI